MKKIFKINFSKIFFALLSGLILTPFITLAADPSQNFKTFANNFTDNVLTTLGTVLMTAAFMFFFYGVVVFIYGRVTQKGDLKDLERGRQFMLWGLIALFVMVSAWGIVRVTQDLLDIDGGAIDIKPVQFNAQQRTLDPANNEDIGDNDPALPLPPFSPVEQAADGTKIENIFANTDYYPLIKIGANSDLASKSAKDGKALTLLYEALIKKNCKTGTFNGIDYNLKSGFGTTYDAIDASFVKEFQKVNGLSVDGVVGKGTWEALIVETGQKTPVTGITVKNCK